MVFSSLVFIFQYLPVVLIGYFLIPKIVIRISGKVSVFAAQNIWLFIVNLFFYGWGEPVYILLMIFSITVNFFAGILIQRGFEMQRRTFAKRILIINCVINILLLVIFKYTDLILTTLGFAAIGISLPIGISFYTFQTMSYPIDLYRRECNVQRNYVDFGTYVALFPQLIAGPIVRYKDIAEQLPVREESITKFASGVERFTIGLAKKVLLANNIGQLWDWYKTQPTSELSMLGAWLGIIAFTFQIYFDFSGYSDMAIGLGRMLGFEFLENFNYPYISRSITEFWRRWHISLSTWFRDYVYIPLGGNRKGYIRQLLNIAIVWSLTGLWHGASWNFLFWGIYYAVLLIIEKLFLLKRLEKLPVINHVYTLIVVMLGWTLFSIEDTSQLLPYLRAMFGGNEIISSDVLYWLRNYAGTLAVLILASTPLPSKIFSRFAIISYVKPVLILMVLIICTAALVDSSYNPFLYFRF